MPAQREDIDEAYRWDLTPIYEDREAWEEAFEEAAALVEEIKAYADTEEVDGETLLTILRLQDELFETVERLSSYANLRTAEDTTAQEFQALQQRASTLSSRASSATSFVAPLIQSFDRAEIEDMVAETDGLERYEHYLDDVLRLKPHTLPREQEELLGTLSEVFYGTGDAYRKLTNADIPFPTVERPDGEQITLTLNNFTTLQKYPSRSFRERVHEAFYDTFEQYQHTILAAYENSVRTDVRLAQIRDHDSARAHALNDANIPVAVYDTLLDTVQDNLAPLHRHVKLKRDALDVDTVRPWDIYMPMDASETVSLTYDDAQGHVLDAVTPLGDDYRDRVERMLDDRRVDVHETPNKRSGAFSAGPYPGPSYVLLNWQGEISDLYTLAHELGHAMHSELTNEAQPYTYSHYPIFTAEIASTVNEVLLTHHLVNEAEDEALRRRAVDEFLERFRSTVYRQTLFAAFEHRVHQRVEEDEPLTTDALHDLYGGLKEEFYAPASMDDRIRYEWMRIPHFYRAFYVYQYATGMSAAVALAEQVRNDGPAAYLDFLRSGSSDYPLALLREAGVDLTEADPIKTGIDRYEAFLDRMADALA